MNQFISHPALVARQAMLADLQTHIEQLPAKAAPNTYNIFEHDYSHEAATPARAGACDFLKIKSQGLRT
jgi:hypothetical protein